MKRIFLGILIFLSYSHVAHACSPITNADLEELREALSKDKAQENSQEIHDATDKSNASMHNNQFFYEIAKRAAEFLEWLDDYTDFDFTP